MVRIAVTRPDRFVVALVHAQKRRGVGGLARLLLRMIGVDVPPGVPIGPGLLLPHSTTGLVLHPGTQIGSNVTLWHGVTIGRADVWRSPQDMVVTIGDRAILGANAVVMCKGGASIDIAPGTVLGANSVLLESTGEDEIWAGNPARRVGMRDG